MEGHSHHIATESQSLHRKGLGMRCASQGPSCPKASVRICRGARHLWHPPRCLRATPFNGMGGGLPGPFERRKGTPCSAAPMLVPAECKAPSPPLSLPLPPLLGCVLYRGLTPELSRMIPINCRGDSRGEHRSFLQNGRWGPIQAKQPYFFRVAKVVISVPNPQTPAG